ncbi:MAG TPA: hypothetical protein VK757_05940 [Candidatus Acidoferrum sp.]|jgi:hypothetical protein|nr:hypothetical protein [Candidatus Acidoferrum sp.]
MHARSKALLSIVVISFLSPPLFATGRVPLTPKFSVGQVVRYRIESTIKTTGKTTSPIVNPEGGSQSSGAIHMQVRLEVLSVATDGKIRLRAVYEKSSAESETDALDLTARPFEARFNSLEGRTFEFTLGSDGSVTNVQDLTAAVSGDSSKALTPELSWLPEVISSENVPQKGAAVGEKWKSEKPVPGALLAGLLSRSESTYLRNEPCGVSSTENSAAAGSATPAPSSEDCAVILTQFEISRSGSPHSDATPEDYRRNGLRTSGAWNGTGESLDSISLVTGLLVSSTQSSTQQMDYQVASTSTGSAIHHTGKTQSQTQITLVPAQP